MMKRNDESLAGVSSRHSRSAFTLMELLVVIGVMAMLASLQLAALTNNRTQGQVMTCRYNLGQLTRAWQMYAEDNAGWFPPNGDFSSSFGRGWIRGALSMNANNPDNTNQITRVGQHPCIAARQTPVWQGRAPISFHGFAAFP
jgi:prepilin-type N-terminal cleavage/methylation domain-containing protein